MDTRTFILQNKLTFTVPLGGVKTLDVQRGDKGGFVAHTMVNGSGLGNLRVRLDVPKIVDLTQNNDLEEVTRWLTFSVFCGNTPVPILSLTRLALGANEDGGSDRNQNPAGPGMDIK